MYSVGVEDSSSFSFFPFKFWLIVKFKTLGTQLSAYVQCSSLSPLPSCPFSSSIFPEKCCDFHYHFEFHICIELQHMASFVSRLFLALSHLWDSSMLCLGFSFLCSIPLYEYTTIHLFYFIFIELTIQIINLQAIRTPCNHFTSQKLLLWKRKILIWAIWETFILFE